MASGRNLRGVLHNFLGTYTSRYAEDSGYWLFGRLVADLEELRFDLLAPAPRPDEVIGVARHLAASMFLDQLAKGGLAPSRLREARVTLQKLPGVSEGFVGGMLRPGHDVRFTADAVLKTGSRHEAEVVVFVAPHDPTVELRSTRGAP